MRNAVRKLVRAGTIGLLGSALTAVWLSPAAAETRTLDTDEVNIESSGFDFGNDNFGLSGGTGSGTVRWRVDENDITPTLEGYLHLNNVDDECARMRIDYYTAGSTFLHTGYGGSKCAEDDDHEYWSVNLAPYTSTRIGKVRIRIEHELSNNDWVRVGSDVWSALDQYNESLSIISAASSANDGYDFGDLTWNGVTQAPRGTGVVHWHFENGQITPHLLGALHLNRVPGACARMRIQYFMNVDSDADSEGELLEEVFGGTVCLNENEHNYWTVDRSDFTSDLIDYVIVSIQSQNDNGTWATKGSSRSEFGAGLVIRIGGGF